MRLARRILGALVLLLAGQVAADPLVQPTPRPLSRADAQEVRAAAERARLAAIRPTARPIYMLRYPVVIETRRPEIRPRARQAWLPEARWDFRPDGQVWTRAAWSAIAAHGTRLEEVVPRDIATWCPGYPSNPPELRRAFWIGMMSALAKHESTWRPEAVGGGDLWYGLLQIYPDTARRYGCRARTGAALKDGADNLACAVRIMNVTVPRDRAIALHDGRWRGVAADWGPMTNRGKIAEMAAWTRGQEYCKARPALFTSLRPRARPTAVIATSGG